MISKNQRRAFVAGLMAVEMVIWKLHCAVLSCKCPKLCFGRIGPPVQHVLHPWQLVDETRLSPTLQPFSLNGAPLMLMNFLFVCASSFNRPLVRPSARGQSRADRKWDDADGPTPSRLQRRVSYGEASPPSLRRRVSFDEAWRSKTKLPRAVWCFLFFRMNLLQTIPDPKGDRAPPMCFPSSQHHLGRTRQKMPCVRPFVYDTTTTIQQIPESPPTAALFWGAGW